MQKNIKILLAYDGSHYLGWQKAKEASTIEGILQSRLQQILQENIKLQAASRTDTGVHAEEQVVNFLTHKHPLDLNKLKRSLNQMLPQDIRVKALFLAPAHFHPTLDTQGKEYHYFLTNQSIQLPFDRHYAWHFPLPLDQHLMKKAAALFVGTHNFKSLCNISQDSPSNFIKTLHRFEIFNQENGFRFEIQGDHFLYKMIRNLVGTVVYVGAKKLSFQEVISLLEKQNRTYAGITAPAHGLFLKKVYY